MKAVKIPVSRLTRRLLLHQYGPEPIKLDRADIRLKELMHVGTTRKNLERKAYALNTTITVMLNDRHQKQVAAYGEDIGYYFYQVDKVKIFRFTWARVTAGLPALDAIKDFYSLHDLEDDDFDLESAERLWKRWREKKEKERHTLGAQSVPLPCDVLLSDRQAETLIRRINSFMKAEAVEMDPRYHHGAECFVMCYFTPLSIREVAVKMKRLKSDVGKSARRFRDYLDHNEDLRDVVAYCLHSTQSRATPSAAS